MIGSIKKYVLVTKPGIVAGNLIAGAAGFLLASGRNPDLTVLFTTITGISLVVASGCVFNNYIDRNIDRIMTRTSNRILAQGLMTPQTALCYGSLLGASGFSLLWLLTNRLCFTIVLIGFVIYVILYSLYLKKHSVFATMIGSLAGAAPPLAGYCAAGNRFDIGAVILLSIFSIWQIPHSYAIAIFRFDDYASAAIPVLPVRRGINTAKWHILIFIAAFTIASLMLTFCGYTGSSYLAAAAALGLIWLLMAWSGCRTSDNRLWARRIFVYSILCIMMLSVMMAFDSRIYSATPVMKPRIAEFFTNFDSMPF